MLSPSPPADTDRTLLVVDDDNVFVERLARAMAARGYAVTTANSMAAAMALVEAQPPAFAVVDLKLGDGNGLDLITQLKHRRPEARGLIVTGFGNIASAVTAVKLGAFDYIAKPADADEIHAILAAEPGGKPQVPESFMPVDRVRWEHIERVFETCGRNISRTARSLGMHRRTLQRMMSKRVAP